MCCKKISYPNFYYHFHHTLSASFSIILHPLLFFPPSELNNNLGGISFGYTEDGKPGFREEGADTVTPFNSAKYNLVYCNIGRHAELKYTYTVPEDCEIIFAFGGFIVDHDGYKKYWITKNGEYLIPNTYEQGATNEAHMVHYEAKKGDEFSVYVHFWRIIDTYDCSFLCICTI